MARDLVREPLLQRSDPPVRIGIVRIENHTNEPFVGGSADMAAQRIQTILFRALREQNQSVGGTAKFIATRRTIMEAVRAQRASKRDGEVTHRGLKDRHGIDYFLSGVYGALDKQVGGTHVVDMVMTFDLTEAETGDVVWTDDCLVKTVTNY
jgi:hypothetical protein